MPLLPFPPHSPLAISSFSARFTPSQSNFTVFGTLGTPASAVWPTANRAIYVPLILPFAYPVKRAFWMNGTAVAGNVDLGIFNADTAAKLFSTGATAQAGTSVAQYVAVDWLIPPGEYYLALSLSSGSGTTLRSTGITTQNILGYLQEGSAHPLPTSMTPVAITVAYVPVFGITKLASF